MTTTSVEARTGFVSVGDAELWFEQRGDGPDVLLLAGLSDPVEAWTFQLDGLADRYRVTAFDNRGAGRSPMPPDGFTVAGHGRRRRRRAARRSASSGPTSWDSPAAAPPPRSWPCATPKSSTASCSISTWARPDVFLRTAMEAWTWLPEAAPSERKMLEAFFLWIYTPRAHEEGMVEQIIEEAMAFPHPQSPEGFRRQLEAWKVHDTFDRLPQINVPTLVVAGEIDMITAPRYGQDRRRSDPGRRVRRAARRGPPAVPGEPRRTSTPWSTAFWSKVVIPA